mmetsp:Transcript_18562/g.25825  ORF Transcript_18562/g.25825 Transcript_18562/m.25825 type:complete len:455 (+) Transcript_18562:174-1538(+)
MSDKGHGDETKNQDFVALPFDSKERWDLIQKCLKKDMKNMEDLNRAIGELHQGKVEFKNAALAKVLKAEEEAESFFQKRTFFAEILPFIQSLVLKLPEAFKERKRLELLKINHPGMRRFSSLQCACLNAAAFFNLLPHGDRCPELSFAFVLQYMPEKVKFLLNYFVRLRTKMPDRYVEIFRNVLPKEKAFDSEKLAESKTPLKPFEVKKRPHMIEDAEGLLQADFANEWIGGGVLQTGCVQEEILFMEKPECLISLFLCQVMQANESITIVGAERFSKHTGYARSTKFAGSFEDKQPLDGKKRISNVVACYDAIIARHTNQFSQGLMLREVNKTYVAVALGDEITIGTKSGEGEAKTPYKFEAFATGNWGCGAFGGDIPLKAMLQWIGCSEAGKDVVYFDFGDRRAAGLGETAANLQKAKVTVGWLWRKLRQHDRRSIHLFKFLDYECKKASSL